MRPWGIGLAVAVVLTLVADNLDSFTRFLIAELGILVVVVLSLNLLMGVAGMLSLATSAFMGVGGYTMLILLSQYHVPLPLAMAAGVVAGWVIGWLLGLVSIRLAGLSLAIVTFGFVQVFVLVVKQGGKVTGDGYGLILPPVSIEGLGKLNAGYIGDICVFLTAVLVTLAWTMTHSRVGRSWFAIKDNEPAAELLGVNLATQKTLVFATTSAMASLAGILQVLLLGVTNPNSYTIDVAITHLAMVVVGGVTGSVAGAVLGPVALFLLPEYFHFLGPYKDVLYGGVLLAALVILPAGLAGLVNQARIVSRVKSLGGSRAR